MKTRNREREEAAKSTEEQNAAQQSTTAALAEKFSEIKSAVSTKLSDTVQAAKEIDRKKATEMVGNAASYSKETAKSISEKSGLLNQDAPAWQIARSASVFLALSAAYDYLSGSTFRAYMDTVAAGAFGLAYANQSGMLEGVKPVVRQAYAKANSFFNGTPATQQETNEQEMQNLAEAAPAPSM